MAISLDIATSSAQATASPLTWSHTVGAGTNTLLIVGVGAKNGGGVQPTVTGVTYNGVSMVKAVGNQFVASTDDYESSIWFLKAPATGANTVSVSFTGTSFNPNIAGVSASYFGVSQTNTPDATGGTTGNTTGAKTFNVITVADNSWVFAVGVTGATAGSGTLTTTQTSRGNISLTSAPTGAVAAEDTNAAVTPAGTQSMGFTVGATAEDGYAMSGASFAPAPTSTLHNYGFNTNNLRPHAFSPGLAR